MRANSFPVATLLGLLLAVSPLAAQIPLSFGPLNTQYLLLTAAQVSAIEANNAAYVQAQRVAGRRVYDLNEQISVELRQDEPDAGVVTPAYQEIEKICRQRQPVLGELIAKNVAVLNERQRGQVGALRYAYLRDRLAERAMWLLLATVAELFPPVPGQPVAVPSLYAGTAFQGATGGGDPRANGVNELLELLETSEGQANEILSRAREYEQEIEENLKRLADLSEQLRKGLVAESGDAGSLAIEIEKIRRRLAKRDGEVRQANRETLSEAQRRRLSELLVRRGPLDTFLEMEAQTHFLLPADDPSAERPATVAAVVMQQRDATQPPQPVVSLSIYPGGSRMLEPLMGLRVCVAGPQF